MYVLWVPEYTDVQKKGGILKTAWQKKLISCQASCHNRPRKWISKGRLKLLQQRSSHRRYPSRRRRSHCRSRSTRRRCWRRSHLLLADVVMSKWIRLKKPNLWFWTLTFGHSKGCNKGLVGDLEKIQFLKNFANLWHPVSTVCNLIDERNH